MFDSYDYKISKVLKTAEEEMLDLKHPYVGSEHLLLALLKKDEEMIERLKKYFITYERFKKELISVVGKSSKPSEIVLYTPLLRRIIENAGNDVSERGEKKISGKDLFVALLDEGEGIAIRLLLGMDIDLSKIYHDFAKVKSNINSKEHLSILEYGILLNDKVSSDEVVVGRDKELIQVMETLLRKNKNNPLLLGKAGVGKTAIVEELVRRINNNEVPEELKNKQVICLEMGSLVAGTKYRGEFEERLNKIIEELKDNKDLIIFIDEIHTLVGAGGAEGAIDASNILKPHLSRGYLKCIGATTRGEYNKYIAKDKALIRRFEIINIDEPTLEETEEILNKIKTSYEKHHNLKITKNDLKLIIDLCDKYIKDRNNPDKCIEVLDSVCAKEKLKFINSKIEQEMSWELEQILNKKAKAIKKQDFNQALELKIEEEKIKEKLNNKSKKNKISKDTILEVMESKTNIPILENKDKLFKNIKENLQEKIYGQDKQVEKILNTLKRKILCYGQRPVTILLAGPTGVGKTETAKVVASCFSKKKSLIRLDMSEYNLETSVNKLIGVSAGYVGYDDEYVFEQVKLNPYSIVLIDEIEKASKKVLNLFLQIFDEGFITDAKGEKIFFNNCIFFLTSNINPKKTVGFSENKIDSIKELLTPELIGRLDETIIFDSVDKRTVTSYINDYLKDKKIKCDMEKVLKNSKYETYGFRYIKRELDNLILEKEYSASKR